MTGCSNQLSVKPQVSNLTTEAEDVLKDEINNRKREYDSFYTTKCEWPKYLGQIENPAQDTLFQTQEIMNKFKDCYIRHNGWVEEYNKDGN